jgi:hypothetical protein
MPITLADLAVRLAPVANDALDSDDPDVLRVGIVLAAVMGCLEAEPFDAVALRALSIPAGLLCEHRIGRHGP